MDDVLIALKTDLASRIAIRYICQLEKISRFNVQVVHIPDLDERGHSPGGGWVHQTWENAMIQKAGKGVKSLLQKEHFYSYTIGQPLIIEGERDQIILEEMKKKQYEFFIEGLLHSFEPDRFFQKLNSDLYKRLSCPVLMVKNLVNLNRGIQIVGTPESLLFLLSSFFKVSKDFPAEPDILVCHFETSEKDVVILENDSNLISGIEDMALGHGKKTGTIRTAKGSSNKLASLVRNHAMVVSPLPESNSHMAHMLAITPCPIMFCPESKMD